MTDASTTGELRRRAAVLAVPPTPAEPRDTLVVLAFVWDDARYAVPATRVRRAVQDVALVTVPGARPPLLGAATVRSHVVPVIDLRSVLDLPAPSRPAPRAVVLDDGARPTLALAADVLARVTTLSTGELHHPGACPPVVRGVESDGTSLLDVDVLLDLGSFFPGGTHP